MAQSVSDAILVRVLGIVETQSVEGEPYNEMGKKKKGSQQGRFQRSQGAFQGLTVKCEKDVGE